MNTFNRYFRIAFTGLALQIVLQAVLYLVVDPYFAAVLSPLFSIWVILFVVGWRKEHPRR